MESVWGCQQLRPLRVFACARTRSWCVRVEMCHVSFVMVDHRREQVLRHLQGILEVLAKGTHEVRSDCIR
eukprot:12220384-Alexandrium_andersonii.AAC.1